MEKKIISLPGGSGQKLPFSPAVVYGSMVFVSGQIGRDETGKLHDESFEAQVVQTMKNVQNILELAGSSFDKVLKITVYLADFDLFKEFNEIYRGYFEGDFPARTTFQVGRLGPGVLIEIDAVAHT
ncbi:MAG: hypothetical protein GTO18_19895 [Anaerolineales bacterium]|nr:hypothetical protein [Anaerolineales bacterium]